jgi:hypothetical protein
MPPTPATPEQISKALTLRAAANLLSKSPVWAVLVAFMQQRLSALETEILTNATLTADKLHERRTQRFYHVQLLNDFRAEFHRAFTSPPISEDEHLQKMAVPPEVEQALISLLSTSANLPAPRPPRPPAPADPKNMDPFSGEPLQPPH